MSELEILLPPTDPLPLQEVVDGLNKWQEELGVRIWLAGHGTQHEQPEDFFERGVEMFNPLKGNYGSVMDMTVPLQHDDYEGLQQTLNNWKHLNAPRVVLLAVRNPSESSDLDDLPPALWVDGLIQVKNDGEKDINYIPSEWVLGVYDRDTGKTVMNPRFTGREVTEADMKSSGGFKYQSMVAVRGLVGEIAAATEHAKTHPDQQSVPIPMPVEGDDDSDLFW